MTSDQEFERYLRDIIALVALHAAVSGDTSFKAPDGTIDNSAQNTAHSCYGMADAMLAERAKGRK